MKVEEKVNKIVGLVQSITTTKEMITKIKTALMNDRLIMTISSYIFNASDATLLNYYDKECSKTDLIKVGLEAMKEKLEENLSIFEQQLEDMLK